MNPISDCDRDFVRLDEGLMHYRHAAPDRVTAAEPVWMMHASPASSRSLEPLACRIASLGHCRVIAPDTPGNGDSAALRHTQPELADYADAFVRMLDALRIDHVNLYGFHTGAHIAIEMAIRHPQRIGRVALDGLLWLEEHEREEFLAHYAPPLRADAWGTQVFQALQFIRDQAWFFPHFKRDPAHNLGGGAMPPTLLHELTVDLLKAAPTYHLAYRAVFRHRLDERLPQLHHPTMLMADEGDPTRITVQRAARLVRASTLHVGGEGWSPAGAAAKAQRIVDFFGSMET
jgi:pimeloyl-ACP methyl ester carboxylesterase